ARRSGDGAVERLRRRQQPAAARIREPEPREDHRMTDQHHHHGYISDKEKYLNRLKRIEGQARGISRMVDEEQYCIDILTQISAVTSALQSVAVGLLDDHLKHCVLDAARAGG